jgi:hypothetical protein
MPPVVLTPAQFRAFTGLESNNLGQRKFRGQLLAHASPDILDCIGVLLSQRLAARTNLTTAVQLTADLRPMWTDSVCVVEAFSAGERSADQHIYLVIADAGDQYVCKVGNLAGVANDLPSNTRSFTAISINRLLADLRTRAKKADVPLPDKLTPAFGSAEYLRWRETIDNDKGIQATRAFMATRKGRR